MLFLENSNISHRMLCLRNVFVFLTDTFLTVKVSDYGLSAFLGEKVTWNEFETAKTSANSIIRWTSAEALSGRKYSLSSDAWSYGVCLWELFSNGKTPYENWTISKVVEQVTSGFRLEISFEIPQGLASLMTSCWSKEIVRPNFVKIVSNFK